MKRAPSIWAVVPAIHAHLLTTTWPVLPQNTKGVQVVFGARVPVPGSEMVLVSGETDQPVNPTFATLGAPGREDPVNVFLHVFTNVHGFNELQTWERLADLGTAIDGRFRSLTTGKPIIPDDVAAAGVRILTVTVTRTIVYPAGGAGANGWLGEAELVVSMQARI